MCLLKANPMSLVHGRELQRAGPYLITALPRNSKHPTQLLPGQDRALAEAHTVQLNCVHDGVPALCQVPQAQPQVTALADEARGGVCETL